MDDEYTEQIAKKTNELKRRSVQISQHINTEDKEVLDKFQEEMERNIDKVSNSKTSINSVAKKQSSIGWFDLIYIVMILLLINYLMGIFMNIFHK
ncbi:hypothetical protein KM1_313940 [Entamoeba histolytica HM-3:IMSS]|uniref:Uncharacterized protein n=1 Tax=Entamoeba histolytica HM-3:IMSS TaxID=885315 RepID=M7VTE3_ENTHI|nr:hypothetical protein KM1_313940 [Entamoeba histolytica HM-3:IMSS]